MSLLVGAVAGAALAWVTHAGIADDGYISLAFARNVAERGCWCVTPGLESNTATSPLWVLLLLVPMLLVPPVVALGAWLVALTAILSALTSTLAQRCGWSWWAGPAAAVLLVCSPVIQASVGLESALAVALLAALALTVVERRPAWAGVVCGLLVLTRPDLGVVAVVAALMLWRRVHVVAAAAVAVCVPWWAVSVALFGTPIPDTLVWKQAQRQGLGGRLLGDAVPLFLERWPAATGLALAGLVAGGVAAVVAGRGGSGRRAAVLLAGGGGVHLAAMVVLGVPPFAWYLAPAAGAAVLLVALAAARAPWWWAPVLGALVVAGAAYTAGHDWRTQGNPFHANGATTDQYAAVAAAVPTGATVATEHGEVGAIAFFCHTRCRVVDPLSDRGRLAPLIIARIATSPVVAALYPGFTPTGPTRADLVTRYGLTGLPVWSGYAGWSHIKLLRTARP